MSELIEVIGPNYRYRFKNIVQKRPFLNTRVSVPVRLSLHTVYELINANLKLLLPQRCVKRT